MFKGTNWISVLVAVVVLQVLGFLWYGLIFSAPWMAEMQAVGLSIDMSSGNQTQSMILGIVVTVVMVLGLSWLTQRLGAHTLQTGVTAGFYAWLFFSLTTQVLEYVYMGFTPKLMAINAGYQLLSFLLAGAVLGGLRFGARAEAAAT
jgi:hypothetical protein